MVYQDWAKRGKEADRLEKWQKFAWELRHAGLLGLKYEVVVRGDLLESEKMEVGLKGEQGGVSSMLSDVVETATQA